MPQYRTQQNLSISKEQIKLIKQNAGKMTINELSILLGLPFQKTYNNIKLLKATKYKDLKTQLKYPPVKESGKTKAKVIDIGTNGYFDIDKWEKLINY